MTNVQVQVVTRAPALSATEVETQITQPIERAMAGIPGPQAHAQHDAGSASRSSRSSSTTTSTSTSRARRSTSGSWACARQIPPEVGVPELGPITTALGEIYMFELRPTGAVPRSAEELRTIVEWQIAPRLRQLRGRRRGRRLRRRGQAVPRHPRSGAPRGARHLGRRGARRARARQRRVAGGGYIERDGEQVVLRGDARFRGIEDIASTAGPHRRRTARRSASASSARSTPAPRRARAR